MPLPDLIEIVPLAQPVRAEITVPGSKSITNRALILAALAEGETILRGALWSEDTQVMTDCLRALGFLVNVADDPHEPCNRVITVSGRGGKIPRGGMVERPLDLFIGNAGTAARFLAAFLCLGEGVYRLHGVPRMHERPQAALFAALRELGYRIDSPNDKLPALIHGGGTKAGRCAVSVAESSQFASALLLAGGVGGWQVEITGANEDELPYVNMTRELVKVFPSHGGEFQIEPDASSGSYFWAAGTLELLGNTKDASGQTEWSSRPTVRVKNWPRSGWQIDERFFTYFAGAQSLTPSFVKQAFALDAAAFAKKQAEDAQHGSELDVSRSRDLGDSIMTAIATASLLVMKQANFTDLGRLRVQECERVVALRTELTKCGAKVVEEGDTLTVYPSQLHGAEIETYNDHRMAMCFAVLGLKVPGIKIKNPSCVKKTFPNFFQKLAAAPPHGLGASLLDARTRQPLSGDALFAD